MITSRNYDYLLGGKDNFAADRAAARGILEVMPAMAIVARAGRAFLATAVRHLATARGNQPVPGHRHGPAHGEHP